MKSIAVMNGVEKMVCDAGFCLHDSLVWQPVRVVFNATLDPTFRVAPSISSPGMTVCVGSGDSGLNPFT